MLCGAQLSHVDLSNADLSGADLKGATLHNVNLEGACLDDADLGGAGLRGTKLTSASVRRACFTGAELDTVEFEGADLTDAVLDGAKVEQCKFVAAQLVATSFRGVRSDKCLFKGTDLERCDLSAGTFQMTLIKGGRLTACAFRGTLFTNGRFKDVAIEGGDMVGCVFDRCLGIEGQDEQDLTDVGALFVLSVTTRMWRAALRSRRARYAVLIGGILLIGVTTAGVASPALWPSALLSWRMLSVQRNGEAAGGQQWCDRYVELGEIVAQRSMMDRPRQDGHLFTTAGCYELMSRLDDAERIHLRRVEVARNDPQLVHDAKLDLGHFYCRLDKAESAEAIAKELLDAPATNASQRLGALQLLADTLSIRGKDGTEDEEWRHVLIQQAEAILAIEHENSRVIGRVPEELYVIGEFEWADRLLTLTTPPLEEETVWDQISPALNRLREQGGVKAALSLVDHLLHATRLASESFKPLLVVEQGAMLLDEGLVDEAEELIAELPEDGAGELGLARIIVEARIALASGDAKGALKVLDRVTSTEHSWTMAETLARCRVDVYLELGDEKAAAQSLVPFLKRVADEASAIRATDLVLGLAGSFSQPSLLSAAMTEAANPYLDQRNAQDQIALEGLRQRAERGELKVTDPEVARALESRDAWMVLQALQMLRLSAQIAGDEASIRALTEERARVAKGKHRAILGVYLLDWSLESGDVSGAHAALTELDLWSCAETEQKARLYEVEVLHAIDAEDFASAHAWLEKLAAEQPSLGDGAEVGVTQRIIDAHRERGQWEQVLELARVASARTKQAEAAETYTRAVIWALYAGDRVDEARLELDTYAASTSKCRAALLEEQTRQALGLPAADGAGLYDACKGSGATAGEQIEVVEYLAAREAADKALALIDKTAARPLSPQEGVRLSLVRVQILVQTGKTEDALAVIEQLGSRTLEPPTRQQVIETQIELLDDLEDADGIVTVYKAYAAHPEAGDLQVVWERAAIALLQMRHGDLVVKLSGEPHWEDALTTTRTTVAIQQEVEAKDFAAAWKLLGEAVDDTESLSDLEAFLWKADELRQHSGDIVSHQEVAAAIRDKSVERTPLWARSTCRVAQALHELGKGEQTVEYLRAALTPKFEGECTEQALTLYARNLGQTAATEGIESELKALEATGYGPADLLLVRLEAVEGSCDAGEYAQGRALLAPLAGKALDGRIVAEHYYSVLRPWLNDGLFEEALTIPTRYPPGPSLSSCRVDLMLVQAMPSEEPTRQQVVERLETQCDASTMSSEDAIAVAQGIAEMDTPRALTFLQGARARNGGLAQAERHRLDVAEARLRCRNKEYETARKLARGVIAEATEAWMLAAAGDVLINGALTDDPSIAPADVEKEARDLVLAIQEMGGEPDHLCAVTRAMVSFYRQRKLPSDAQRWQRELLTYLPAESYERGWELLAAARVEMAATGSGGGRSKSYVEEARAIAEVGSDMEVEVLRVDLERKLLSASPGRISSVIAANVRSIPKDSRQSLLHEVASTLEGSYNQPGKAEAVREYADSLAPEPGTDP